MTKKNSNLRVWPGISEINRSSGRTHYMRVLTIAGCLGLMTASISAQPPVGKIDPALAGMPTDRVPNHEMFVLEQLFNHRHEPGYVQALQLAPDIWLEIQPLIDEFQQSRDRLVGGYGLALQELKLLNFSEAERQGREQELFKDNREKRLRLIEESWAKFHEVLSPQDVLQLEMIALQRQFVEVVAMRMAGAASLIANRLGLTEKEAADLDQELEEIRKEFEPKLIELRKDCVNRILDSLPADARKKVDELIGEIYLEGHDRFP